MQNVHSHYSNGVSLRRSAPYTLCRNSGVLHGKACHWILSRLRLPTNPVPLPPSRGNEDFRCLPLHPLEGCSTVRIVNDTLCLKNFIPCFFRTGAAMTIDNRHAQILRYAKELRKNMTEHERKLWFTFLKDHPLRFSRQKVMDTYILDFTVTEPNLP